MNRLDKIEGLANSATKGPWYHETDPYEPPAVLGPLQSRGEIITQDWIARDVSEEADAKFIARARTYVPDLVKAVRAVLALHIQMPSPFYTHDICAHPQCKSTHDSEEQSWWPCPTVKAIYNSLGERI